VKSESIRPWENPEGQDESAVERGKGSWSKCKVPARTNAWKFRKKIRGGGSVYQKRTIRSKKNVRELNEAAEKIV